jgi:tripartite-type tricarboxylate transporter receptor subunit TctC
MENVMNEKSDAGRRWRFVALLLAAGAATFAVLSAPMAHAQAYPTKPIKIITPVPPGGPSDIVARLYGQKLTEKWGQPVIIENRPGGNGVIAAELAAKSAPDGYTLFQTIDFVLTMNQAMYAHLLYDPVKSFAPVSLLTTQVSQISTNPKFPAKSLKDVVEYAKANPGKINFGYSVINGLVLLEQFKAMAGIEVTNVPYKGASAIIPALLAGDIDMDVSEIPTHAPHIKAGRMRGLATTGPSRSATLPDVPTVAEAGYPGLDGTFWFGLVAPAGTPKAIVDKLNAELNTILRLPEIRERLAASGMDSAPSTPEQFAALIKADSEKWSKVIRAAKIHLD